MNSERSSFYAEIINSPDYSRALNAAFEQNPDGYEAQRDKAQELILETLGKTAAFEPGELTWEIRRQMALSSLEGQRLGQFADIIDSHGGELAATTLTKEDLGPGEPGAVMTNTQIKRLFETYRDPIDFLDQALKQIHVRRQEGQRTVGPENFASALKYFVDKEPSPHLDIKVLQQLMTRWTAGFDRVSKTDPPNFVEMTNIYFSIYKLPRGVFPPELTDIMIRHSLEQLPTFHPGMSSVFFSAMANLPIREDNALEAASLIDLTIRHLKPMETTRDFRLVLNAVANLPDSSQKTTAIKTFLEYRNNLETVQPQFSDLFDLRSIVESLLSVVNEQSDPKVNHELAQIALSCRKKAMFIYNRAVREGFSSPEELETMRFQAAKTVEDSLKIID